MFSLTRMVVRIRITFLLPLVLVGSGVAAGSRRTSSIERESRPKCASLAVLNGRITHRAAEAETDAITLWTDEPSRHEVAGIVCDNLRGMPEAQRDHLSVELPPSWKGAKLTGWLGSDEAKPGNEAPPQKSDGRS